MQEKDINLLTLHTDRKDVDKRVSILTYSKKIFIQDVDRTYAKVHNLKCKKKPKNLSTFPQLHHPYNIFFKKEKRIYKNNGVGISGEFKGKVKSEKSYGFDALTFQSPRLSEAYQGLVRLSIH